jgi:hypothetical protein
MARMEQEAARGVTRVIRARTALLTSGSRGAFLGRDIETEETPEPFVADGADFDLDDCRDSTGPHMDANN